MCPGVEKGISESVDSWQDSPSWPFSSGHSQPFLTLCFETLGLHVTISLMSQMEFCEES